MTRYVMAFSTGDAMHTETTPDPLRLFNLDDDAEAFMAGVLSHFHTETPGLRTLAAVCRLDVDVAGKRHRVVLTATGFRRRGGRMEWHVIAWDIDDVSIHFRRQLSRDAAVAAVERG